MIELLFWMGDKDMAGILSLSSAFYIACRRMKKRDITQTILTLRYTCY